MGHRLMPPTIRTPKTASQIMASPWAVQEHVYNTTVPATCLPHTGFAGVWTPATYAELICHRTVQCRRSSTADTQPHAGRIWCRRTAEATSRPGCSLRTPQLRWCRRRRCVFYLWVVSYCLPLHLSASLLLSSTLSVCLSSSFLACCTKRSAVLVHSPEDNWQRWQGARALHTECVQHGARAGSQLRTV